MKKKKQLIKYLIQITIIVLVTTMIFTRVIIPIKVEGESMYPTLNDGDFAVVNAMYLSKEDIQRFDVVVLKSDILDKNIIKRIIGLPGETVTYKEDRLYINGVYYAEPFLDQDYIEEAKSNYRTDRFTNDFEITLKDDELFVLGDNRLQSTDSRALGSFGYEDIIGKKGLVVFPFNNMKFID